MSPTRYWCEHLWTGGEVRDGVLVEIEGDRIARVEAARSRGNATTLDGLTIPGLANTHSHAFHRALRGRTHDDGGTFWTWREQMYALAGTLEPDSYRELAHRTYREMVAAGITRVGEFHYLHHRADGTPYDDPNAMAYALIEAASEAGLRMTLLDTLYLTGGFGRPLEGVQRRFGDGTAAAWASRVDALRPGPASTIVGAAIHSVRAVPADQLDVVRGRAPLHVHLSEQPQENTDCENAYGKSPTRLLHDHGILGPATTAVHATHLSDDDIALLGRTGTAVSMCPTTERDLADGIGRARDLDTHGSPIVLGSDSHAVIDLFEEARAVELDERLRTLRRGHWTPDELLAMATVNGHRSLGCTAGGTIEAGAYADLVTLDVEAPTAGQVVFAATRADIVHVVASGRAVRT